MLWYNRDGSGPYKIINYALRVTDLVPLVTYRLEGSPMTNWSCPAAEFFDGRFMGLEAYQKLVRPNVPKAK